MRRQAQERKRREPTIALINIVFLMLVFFLIAGTIAPPQEGEINLVSLADLDGTEPSEALAIFPDGRVVWQGAEIDPTTFKIEEVSTNGALRMLPDRELPAWRLIDIAAALQSAGAEEILVVTERSLE